MPADKPYNDEPAANQYDHSNYRLTMKLLPNGEMNETDQDSKWCLELNFWCHDLPKLMREGLWWSCANIVPTLGFSENLNLKGTRQERYTRVRRWFLREDPNKDRSQVPWRGAIDLLTIDYNTLAEFSLNQMSRDNIYSCTAFNRQEKWIFHCKPNSKEDPAINCIYEGLHPDAGSWWIWPMDSLDPPTPAPDDDVVDKTDVSPVGYAKKPDVRCNCLYNRQNISITWEVWRAIFSNKRN